MHHRPAQTITLTLGLLIMFAPLLSACSNLALQALNTPSYLFSDLELTRDIAYGEAEHQRLDLYLPASDAPEKNALVVFVYGGSWTSGNKEAYYFVADALTQRGYAVAIPDYIKYPADTFPAFVEDIALAVAWLSENAALYNEHTATFLMGHSAGAHTTALLVTDPTYLGRHDLSPEGIAGYVGLAGPYSFKPKEQKFRDIFANLEDFSQMRPLHFVSGSEPPMLLLHGDKDTTVLTTNTQQFSSKVNDMGGEATGIFYPSLGHVDIVLSFSRVVDRDDTVLNDILLFLEKSHHESASVNDTQS